MIAKMSDQIEVKECIYRNLSFSGESTKRFCLMMPTGLGLDLDQTPKGLGLGQGLTPLGLYDMFIRTRNEEYSVAKDSVYAFINTLNLKPLGVKDLCDKVRLNYRISSRWISSTSDGWSTSRWIMDF